MNIATKEEAEQRHAEGLKDGLPIAEELVDEHLQDARHREQERDRARSWRSCRRTRRAVAAVRRRLKGRPAPRRSGRGTPSQVPRPGPGAQPLRRPRREDPPSRMSTSQSQRSASSITWLETRTVVPSRARRSNDPQRPRLRTGSSPTVGSSRTSSSGRLRIAAEGQPGTLAAREGDGELRLPACELDELDHLGDAVVGDVDDGGEVVEVLAHGEVRVHRRCLGLVADPGA